MKTTVRKKSVIIVLGTMIWLLGTFIPPVSSGNFFRRDSDIVGKIVDFDTREPIPGVVVMAMWTVDIFRLVIEPATEYYDYFETLSDENGEFKIPGKGVILVRDVNPPKIKIFKTGYGAMYLSDLNPRFIKTSPYGSAVGKKDGRFIIAFKQKTMAERKKAIEATRQVPFREMARPGMDVDTFRLYREEVTRAYHALNITPYWLQNHMMLQVRPGGVFPAADTAVKPARGK
jgi:hypothetical protein